MTASTSPRERVEEFLAALTVQSGAQDPTVSTLVTNDGRVLALRASDILAVTALGAEEVEVAKWQTLADHLYAIANRSPDPDVVAILTSHAARHQQTANAWRRATNRAAAEAATPGG